jgi:hypothetical protein
VGACWTSYESLSFKAVAASKDPAPLRSFLEKFPHGRHVGEAREAIALLQFAPFEEQAHRANEAGPVLDFAEQHPELERPRQALVKLGVAKRSHVELERILKLAALPAARADSRFASLAAAARDRLAELDLDTAAHLPGQAAVDALRAWTAAHPGSPLLGREKLLEADKAFEAAMQATGEASVAALRAFQQTYAGTPNVQRAHDAEVERASRVALDATTPGPMWHFLDNYQGVPQYEAVRAALAALLAKGEAGCTGSDYDAYLGRFPDDPMKRALSDKMRGVKKKEAEERAVRAASEQKRAAAAACASKCVASAQAACAALPDSGSSPSPRAVCASRALRPCCPRCGLQIDSTTFSSCQ